MKYRIPFLIGLFAGLVTSFGLIYFFVLPQEQGLPSTAALTADSLGAPVDTIAPTSKSSDTSIAAEPTTTDSTDDWTQGFHPRFLMGKFTQDDHPDMVRVPKELTDGDGSYYLLRSTLEAFQKMHAAAQADGVELYIVSAFRNFDRQKAIWEAKWNGQRLLEGTEKADEVYPDPADRATAILRYSSMPGTSRHHWGTDLDVNDLNNSYFASGEGLKIYTWLVENAATYGFCQTYTAKGEDRPDGYEEEKWHWSYTPLSEPLTAYAEKHLRDTMIQGFAGAESAPLIGVVNKYVLGINTACRE